MASRWQHCAQFNRPIFEPQTSGYKGNCVTAWPTGCYSSYNFVLFIICSNCCHSCCRTENCNNDPCFEDSGVPPTPGLATTSRSPAFPGPRPLFKQCLQGQRILLNGIEISNTQQMSRCPDQTDVCHRYDITALENGQTGKKCAPKKLATDKVSWGVLCNLSP